MSSIVLEVLGTEQVQANKKKQVRVLSFAVSNKIVSISFNISKSHRFQPEGIWLYEVSAFANNCPPQKKKYSLRTTLRMSGFIQKGLKPEGNLK